MKNEFKPCIQPFREDGTAGECEECHEVIYSGDLAYMLGGEMYCMGCVKHSSFIARADGGEDQDILY